ncbi:hypothetical protein [Patulibacter sp.]|uniref:hypothetical protein n=1 Tax=Patulibacter sp. TaxID=1912859 RepID=UPI00271883AC|nr:hypothetical protein [Patulibacter sp.]MDO9407310.1 hypothetical protein [Patulibacter sp.]
MRTSSRVVSDLKAALADYDHAEEAFREAVGFERIDAERRRSCGREDLALPKAKPGRADRMGRELERRLPLLGDLVRAAVRESGHPGDLRRALSDVARALDGHDVTELALLVLGNWRDPWAGGRHGAPSPFDPKRPTTAVPEVCRPVPGVRRRPRPTTA